MTSVILIPQDDIGSSIDWEEVKSNLSSIKGGDDEKTVRVKKQLQSIIQWSSDDGLCALMRSRQLVNDILRLTMNENEEVAELASSALSYVSGRSAAGPYTRRWNFLEGNVTHSISIYEPSYTDGAGLGWKTWNASIVLVQWLGLHREQFMDKVILELGCGTGLAGIFCAKFGAKHVNLSDWNAKVLQIVQDNAFENQTCNTTTVELDWNRVISQYEKGLLHDGEHHCHKIIVGSDIVYDPEHVNLVPKVIDILLEDNKVDARVFIGMAQRPEIPGFFQRMKELKFNVLETHHSEFIESSGQAINHTVAVFGRD